MTFSAGTIKSITHLALCTWGCVPNQKNFDTIEDTPAPPNSQRLRLSLRIGDNDMADKKPPFEKKDDKKVEKDLEKEAESEIEQETEKPKNLEVEVMQKAGKSGAVDSELIEGLGKLGIQLGDDVSEKNLIERLKPAVLTLVAELDKFESEQKGPEGAREKEIDPNELINLEEELKKEQTPTPNEGKDNTATTEGNNPGKPLKEEPQTMTMSLQEKRLNLIEKKYEDSEKNGMLTRVRRLLETGRITPVLSEKLKTRIGVFKLSLNGDGTEQNSATKEQIEDLELLPAGAAWSPDEKVRLHNISEQALPREYSEMSEDDAEKIANKQIKLSGKSLNLN